MSDDPTPAEVPRHVTFTAQQAFDMLEAFEAMASRAWEENDVEGALTYERLATAIRRALEADE